MLIVGSFLTRCAMFEMTVYYKLQVFIPNQKNIQTSTFQKKMQNGGFIYIITNKNKTTIYIGVTSNLINRLEQHKTKYYSDSFSAKYNLTQLIYYEKFNSITDAIIREKEIKHWSRKKKELLIATTNPNWLDLYETEVKNWLYPRHPEHHAASERPHEVQTNDPLKAF